MLTSSTGRFNFSSLVCEVTLSHCAKVTVVFVGKDHRGGGRW